eukprot:1159437-Pelagomonas_calceolata.AAC.11
MNAGRGHYVMFPSALGGKTSRRNYVTFFAGLGGGNDKGHCCSSEAAPTSKCPSKHSTQPKEKKKEETKTQPAVPSFPVGRAEVVHDGALPRHIDCRAAYRGRRIAVMMVVMMMMKKNKGSQTLGIHQIMYKKGKQWLFERSFPVSTMRSAR